MEKTHARPPKMLPWLAKKAGVGERRAEALWRTALHGAALRTGAPDTAAYWKDAMDHWLELMAAESLREDAASFGMRRLSRLQARTMKTSLSLLDALALSMARGWRVLGQSISVMAP